MGSGSTLNPDIVIHARPGEGQPPGHDVRTLGPSDSSDTGSDLIGVPMGGRDDTGDRYGTGEGMSVEDGTGEPFGSEISPDRIVTEAEAGLGAGLDQAEEARLGITDEELEEFIRDQLGVDDDDTL